MEHICDQYSIRLVHIRLFRQMGSCLRSHCRKMKLFDPLRNIQLFLHRNIHDLSHVASDNLKQNKIVTVSSLH